MSGLAAPHRGYPQLKIRPQLSVSALPLPAATIDNRNYVRLCVLGCRGVALDPEADIPAESKPLAALMAIGGVIPQHSWTRWSVTVRKSARCRGRIDPTNTKIW
ncbi:hypothetical protein ABH37_14705 [Mycobacterium haemophilum]|uniref:Uncharacterized protein n=1 Tax=Mycobacterium haemophilum TaxID=29311 RepID=A0A0I9TDX0_9MYCO|nr:hypothetical protein ABH39_18010 [Mycobacterium haemophilum]KLO34584.1 hypothetical protein ABH38_18470 [Mycobacterium haemophilum]KLO40898.1 hypothetical protein ABH37_14705 [Mycobacterium haemophilum]KLO46511.1 hypothetical protein ABH36_18145 [Mycobacterium haemophilum]